jgi:hypothetical protein
MRDAKKRFSCFFFYHMDDGHWDAQSLDSYSGWFKFVNHGIGAFESYGSRFAMMPVSWLNTRSGLIWAGLICVPLLSIAPAR